MFYLALVLLIGFFTLWDAGAFLESLEELNIVVRTIIAILSLGGIPALIVVGAGTLDLLISTAREERRKET